ncbi:unnamed protein product [Symbiodinium natans]|uniref:Uncharacterized protein n=1 Tax=Symbiodinium natans TaxID=878477 RepID=A0A812PBP5_9DINO|nr:unnamed protein product [Symbiodinium natans]
METVWGFAGGVDVAGVSMSHVLGFGTLDTGAFMGVHVKGGESAAGNFIISAQQHWKQTTHTRGMALMGLKLEVPYQLSETSGETLSICGLEWYRCSELRDTTLWGQSCEKHQTFLLLVEVRESFVETWFGSRRNQLSIAATPELKGIVGRGAASAIAAFFAALDGALDVGLSCMAANLSSTLSKTLLESSPAWAALKGGCKVEDFGREWLKQFIQLQLLRLLSQVGVPGTALQLLVLLKAAVSGTPHGWILAYIVVPLLLELFKTASVQCVLGQVSKAVVACAASLKEWVAQALAMLGKFLAEVAGVVTATAAGISTASAASAALAPSACVAGSQSLGTVAVSLGLMATPAAPAGAVLGVASVSGVVVGAVVLFGFKHAQMLWQEEFSLGSWHQRLEKDSLVSVFITKPRRRWVEGRVCHASAKRVSVKYFLGNEEHQIPLDPDCSRLRPGGADGAVLAISVIDLASPVDLQSCVVLPGRSGGILSISSLPCKVSFGSFEDGIQVWMQGKEIGQTFGSQDSRSYVLLRPGGAVEGISGTFNPPHRGHVRIGLQTKVHLNALGHHVGAICYVPVHDNYMLNKQTLASKSKSGVPKDELGASEIFFPMARRCELLQELVDQEGPEAKAICHVLDYELRHGTQLLEDSPNYWAKRLPEGYLRTVPTKALLNHFAAHSPLVKDGMRLAAVFGVDNLAGMASWNNPAELLEKTDLVLISRQAEAVQLGQDPSALFSAMRRFQIDAQVVVKYGETELFGSSLGSFENASASGAASLFLLPALEGPDEALSSSRVRESVVSNARLLQEHGYSRMALVRLCQDVLSSAAALEAAHADAQVSMD